MFLVQSGWSVCRTGNGKKLSSSQAQLGQAAYLAVALFLSVSCAPSTPSTLYVGSRLLRSTGGLRSFSDTEICLDYVRQIFTGDQIRAT